MGDRVDGVIVEEPELQPDKYGGPGDKVLVLSIRDDDGEIKRLYARKQQLGRDRAGRGRRRRGRNRVRRAAVRRVHRRQADRRRVADEGV